jgi:transcription initiation factor TFIID subunit TAF12
MGKDGNLYKANHTVSESLSGSGHLTSPVRLSKDANQHHHQQQQQQQQQQIVMVPQQHTLGGWMGEGLGGSPSKQPLQPIEGS